MLITRGWGVLAVVIPVIGILVGIGIFGANGNASRSILFYSSIASGIATFFVGILLNEGGDTRHDLFFLPLTVWGAVWIVLGGIGVLFYLP